MQSNTLLGLFTLAMSKTTEQWHDIVDRGKMKIKGSMVAAQKFTPEIFKKTTTKSRFLRDYLSEHDAYIEGIGATYQKSS